MAAYLLSAPERKARALKKAGAAFAAAEGMSSPLAPVGVFDSGVGGLTVARAIIDQLPDEDIVYVGDTGNGPYGPLTIPEIRAHALAIGDDLVERGVKALVIACNSASAACLRDARERYDVPVVEVILPAVRRAVATTRNGRIGVIGTQATITSHAYQDAFAAARDTEITAVACPRFVDFVERGVTSGRQVLGLAEGYLEPLQRAEVDTLVLGCTHYPLLSGLIQLAMGDNVTLVSSAEETAKEVLRVLTERDLLRPHDAPPATRVFEATGDPEAFTELGGAIPRPGRHGCSTSAPPFSCSLNEHAEILTTPKRRCFLHRSIGHGTVVSVRITVLGCSGSVVGPDSPASGYLLRAADTPPLVLDFGGGVLGALQRHADPGSVHVLLSHLHADHCLDMPGLYVWRRYHPTRPTGKALLYGPSDTWSRLGAASSPYGGEIDDCSDIFDIRHWVDGEPVTLGALTVVPRVVAHPTESYGLRITDPSGACLVYSGDTGSLRSARRAGPRRRRLPVRGLLDTLTGPSARSSSVRHRSGQGRETSGCPRVAADAYPAVDVARGRDHRGQGRVRWSCARGGVR